MRHGQRSGDDLPFKKSRYAKLAWWPAEGEPFRWLPRHGEPLCIGELVAQKIVKTVAWLPVYVAIVVTLVLIVQVFAPFGIGR